MKKRHLSEGFEVSALGLGCMGMSEFYGPRDDETSLAVLNEAVSRGITFLDTADMYGPHHNEELLGRFLSQSGSRSQLKIATKFGIVRKPGEYARSLDMSPAYLRQACEASLTRLGVEQIDLYYVHRVNPDQNIEDTMGELSRLVEEGKIDRIGLCEVSATTLRRAHNVHPVTALQTEYSLWSRGVEAEILPACRELGIGFVPYSPLGRGFLTGRFQAAGKFGDDDFRSFLPRFQQSAMKQNIRIVEAVQTMAHQKGCTPGQIALAWLLAQGDDIVPIPGTKRLSYLIENIAAANVSMTPSDMQSLDAILSTIPVTGERYTEEGMKGVNA
ncbi:MULTISPECIES: aldo/keto reductase [Cohaesibacter]|uniref:aldo/keto reductase n=1 Tax=Cohaesibacter TaxID=655352 RepID=UPI000DEBE107|nr:MULTISPECIES: aldo/keto reductase [Cohaesibacter]TLP49192.1 aldo/keto reductase [Cohaesibacter sp. CAU 1516]